MLSAAALNSLNRTEEALSEAAKALKIEPDMPIALLVKSIVLMQAGRLEEVASLLEQLRPIVAPGRLHPGWFGVARDASVVLHGEPREAEAAFQRLVQVASGSSPFFYWEQLIGSAIQALTSQGTVDVAGQLLPAYYRSGGAPPYDSLLLDPNMQWVLHDPQFAELVQRSRAEFEEILSILNEACARGELPAYLEQPLADLLDDLGMPCS